MPRFTAYSSATAGQGYHTVRAQRDHDGWTLTLVFTPHRIQQPPDDATLTGTEWSEFILAQSTEIAACRAPRSFVTYPGDHRVEVRPSVAAGALARHLLGEAWAVLDGGRGYTVALRS